MAARRLGAGEACRGRSSAVSGVALHGPTAMPAAVSAQVHRFVSYLPAPSLAAPYFIHPAFVALLAAVLWCEQHGPASNTTYCGTGSTRGPVSQARRRPAERPCRVQQPQPHRPQPRRRLQARATHRRPSTVCCQTSFWAKCWLGWNPSRGTRAAVSNCRVGASFSAGGLGSSRSLQPSLRTTLHI